MLNGKNKIKVKIITVILILSFTSCFNETKQRTMEERYDKLVSLGAKDSLQDRLLSNLKKLGLKEGESKRIKIERLIGFNFKRLILIDKMVMDFSLPCPELRGTSALANKEFCQFGIIYKNDGTVEYLRGICDYDLMGLSRSFDKTGFSMNNPIEIILPDDKVVITYSLKDRVPYFIEPLSHKMFKTPHCR